MYLVLNYLSAGSMVLQADKNTMKRLTNLILKLQVWKDTKGQDLIEYALMAGFVAVAAGAIMPGVSTNISKIFSKVASVMTGAASQGS
jgi:pilus assembly protein Flp/PilA